MNPLAQLQPVDLAGTTQNALLRGLQVGDAMRQRKQQEMQSQAMDNAYRGAMSGNANAFTELANVPGMAKDAYGMQQAQRTAQTQQADADRMRLGKVADLLDNSTDEPSYQRNLAVARQLGLPVDSAPANFDPEFIQTQSAIAKAVLNNDPELPLIAQEAIAAGLQPGTPQFQAEIGRILKSKYSTSTTVSYQPGRGAVAYDRASGGITPLIVPGGRASGAVGGIPAEAIADLRSNPASAAQFDEIFGQGAAAQALGGGGSNVTSGF